MVIRIMCRCLLKNVLIKRGLCDNSFNIYPPFKFILITLCTYFFNKNLHSDICMIFGLRPISYILNNAIKYSWL
jgi:hypothetical protein